MSLGGYKQAQDKTETHNDRRRIGELQEGKGDVREVRFIQEPKIVDLDPLLPIKLDVLDEVLRKRNPPVSARAASNAAKVSTVVDIVVCLHVGRGTPAVRDKPSNTVLLRLFGEPDLGGIVTVPDVLSGGIGSAGVGGEDGEGLVVRGLGGCADTHARRLLVCQCGVVWV